MHFLPWFTSGLILLFVLLALLTHYSSRFPELFKRTSLDHFAMNHTIGVSFDAADVPSDSRWIIWTSFCLLLISVLVFVELFNSGGSIRVSFVQVLALAAFGTIIVLVYVAAAILFALQRIKLENDGIHFYSYLFVKTQRGLPNFLPYARCRVRETLQPTYLFFGTSPALQICDGNVIVAAITLKSWGPCYQAIRQELSTRLSPDQISLI